MKAKDFGISPDSLHCELKIGVTGSFESRSGHVASGLASAIYVSLDGNFKEVKHDQSLFATNFLDEDTTFMIGPVPIPIGISGSFNLNAEIDFTTDINYAIAFVGMYGAGTEDNEEKWFQINDYPGLYGRAGLSANIRVNPKIGVKIPGIGKRIEIKWATANIADGEMYLNKDHELKFAGQFLGNTFGTN